MESGRYSRFLVGVALFLGRGRQYEALNKVFRTTGIAKMFALSVRAWKSGLNSITKLCRNYLFESQCTVGKFRPISKEGEPRPPNAHDRHLERSLSPLRAHMPLSVAISTIGYCISLSYEVRAAMERKKRWMYVPPKPAKPKVPEYLKSAVKSKTDEFVESFPKTHLHQRST